jgi:ribosomal protein L16 Arg81 hydroxylase
MYMAGDEPFFPFYWTANPWVIKGAVYERLSEFEREAVAYLESLNQMSTRDLLDADGTPAVLERYLSKLYYEFPRPFV